jgi:hypothetical protein
MILLFVFLFASLAFSQAPPRPAWLPAPSSSSSPVHSAPAPAPVARTVVKTVAAPDPRVDTLSQLLKAFSARLDSLTAVDTIKPDTLQRQWHVVWTVANADTLHSFGIRSAFDYPRKYSDLLGIVDDVKKAGKKVYEFSAALNNYDTLRYVMGGTSSRSTGNVITSSGNYEGAILYYNIGLTMSIYPDGKADIEYIGDDHAQTTLRLSARRSGNCISASTQFLSTDKTRVLWILWTHYTQQVKHLWLSACYEDSPG